MQVEGAEGLPPALASLFGGGGDAGAQDEPSMTAVDLACCVSRHIPTLEAFLEAGVRPSEPALALAERAVPIMR